MSLAIDDSTELSKKQDFSEMNIDITAQTGDGDKLIQIEKLIGNVNYSMAKEMPDTKANSDNDEL